MNIWTDVRAYNLYKAILTPKEFVKWKKKFIAYLDLRYARWLERLAKQQQNGDKTASPLNEPKLASNIQIPKLFLKYVQVEKGHNNVHR